MIPVTGEDIAPALGLDADSHGLPTRVSVASLIRKFVSMRRFAETEEAKAWFLDLVSQFGMDAELCRARFETVVRLLTASGDIGKFSSGEGDYLVAVEARTVEVGHEEDILLGDIESLENDLEKSSLLRRASSHSQSVALEDHVGCPPWAMITQDLELSVGLRPGEILQGALTRLRQHGSPDYENDSTEILASCGEGTVCFARTSSESGMQGAILNSEVGELSGISVTSEEYLGWLYLASAGLAALEDWPAKLPMPDRLLSMATLLATPTDDSLRKWEFSEWSRSRLSEWSGIDDQRVPEGVDTAQTTIIEANREATLLVSAGPGSGKTWTLCARIGHLVDAGVAPSRILVVSFTRAAVSEIRKRIADFLDNPEDAYSVNIQTLDSLAWSLVAADDPAVAKGTNSYDSIVGKALQLLDKAEDWLLDTLERFRHVMVDEAQDLTGIRKSLIFAVLDKLDSACGVTIFHDPAQAIYGFVEGEPSGIRGATELESYDQRLLDRNHRCRSENLKEMFLEGRELLARDDLSADQIYDGVRSLIENAAEASQGRRVDTSLSLSAGRAFHLFRWRSQLVLAVNDALRSGQAIRTRLSSGQTLVQPWVSAVLRRAGDDSMSREFFDNEYRELSPMPYLSPDAAWEQLRIISELNQDSIDLKKLASAMAGAAPIAEIALVDVGPSSAPLYSTIHAAKGREAETVVLTLPSRIQNSDDAEILEEARVLFVAASRASQDLRIAYQQEFMGSPGQDVSRNWREWKNRRAAAAKIEFGVPGDIEPIVYDQGSSEAENLSYLLWQKAGGVAKAHAVFRDGKYQIYLSESSASELPVARLSRQCASDLWAIGTAVGEGSVRPSSRIENIFVVGSASIASEEQDGSPRFDLVPIIAGCPVVFFNPER